MGRVDMEETRVKDDRDKLEDELRTRKDAFIKSIDIICDQIDNLKYNFTGSF